MNFALINVNFKRKFCIVTLLFKNNIKFIVNLFKFFISKHARFAEPNKLESQL